ncbi:CoA ester lyase [Rhodococcus sp. RS1C4]|uniref:HpcH/HpaI aldolase/citrate lyase family protein n=1 Tax=Rhodococcoides fascians TaxID=1828 RepID=UPI00036292A1|nr:MULTISPECIES: CoA ester lyase [Rhodococcus]OZC49188.1 CoA ester lyase [Rhodococcus sp. 06-621-2]OZC53282.1 CoA ester lyase [Rhodococcus sp. RS1C4]OZD69633.1 CoA ester lyase [Rhodococcus sp. 06-1059B-a]OZF07062.1 CoA ester lyase [Rhodococcus sp. 15-1154-1]
MTALTFLYVPGDVPARFDKASRSGADAVVLDLEDAVVASNKDEARSTVAAWLAACEPGQVEIWVRVNPGALQDADIRAVAGPNLTGIWLPKVESLEEIEAAARILDTVAPHAELSALIETGKGLLALPAIATGPRLRFLQIGEVDLAADLSIEPGDDGRALLFARSQVVVASAAAGLEPPLAAVSVEFRDTDAFAADTVELRRLGFRGRACIHPAQVAPARDAFVPTSEAVQEAEEILEALAQATSGVGVDKNGRLIDEAVARSARRVVQYAQSRT